MPYIHTYKPIFIFVSKHNLYIQHIIILCGMGVPPFSMEIPKRSILIDLGRIQVPERLPFQFQTVMYLAYSYKRYVSFPPGEN